MDSRRAVGEGLARDWRGIGEGLASGWRGIGEELRVILLGRSRYVYRERGSAFTLVSIPKTNIIHYIV